MTSTNSRGTISAYCRGSEIPSLNVFTPYRRDIRHVWAARVGRKRFRRPGQDPAAHRTCAALDVLDITPEAARGLFRN